MAYAIADSPTTPSTINATGGDSNVVASVSTVDEDSTYNVSMPHYLEGAFHTLFSPFSSFP